MLPTTADHLWNLLVGTDLSGAFWPEAVLLALMLGPWAAGLGVATSGGGSSLRRRVLRWAVGFYLFTRLVADFVLWGPILSAVATAAAAISLFTERPIGSPHGRWARLAAAMLTTGLAALWPEVWLVRVAVCTWCAALLVPPLPTSEPPGRGRPSLARLVGLGFVLHLALDGLTPQVYLPLTALGAGGGVLLGFELWRRGRLHGVNRRLARWATGIAWGVTSILALLTVLELYFCHIYDTSDANVGLQTCKLWWSRHVRYNSWQFRGPEIEPLERFDDSFRIVVLGDSFAFGQGIDDENDLLGAQLARELGSRLPGGRAIATFNLSRVGIGTADEMGVCEHFGPRIRPKVVVLAYMINDIGEAVPFRAVSHPALARWRRVSQASVSLDFLVWRIYTRFVMGGRDKPPPDLTYFADADIWQRHRASLETLIRTVREEGCELVVAAYPFLRLPAFAGLQRQALDKVLAVLAEHDVPAVDVSRVVDVTDPQYVVNPFDPHPNEKLNRAVAVVLAEVIARRLVAPQDADDGA